METKKSIIERERTLLRRYFPQMEGAVRNSCAAVPSSDMAKLHEIYKAYISPSHIFRPWCSHCKMEVLKGLYEFAKRTIYGNDKTSED